MIVALLVAFLGGVILGIRHKDDSAIFGVLIFFLSAILAKIFTPEGGLTIQFAKPLIGIYILGAGNGYLLLLVKERNDLIRRVFRSLLAR